MKHFAYTHTCLYLKPDISLKALNNGAIAELLLHKLLNESNLLRKQHKLNDLKSLDLLIGPKLIENIAACALLMNLILNRDTNLQKVQKSLQLLLLDSNLLFKFILPHILFDLLFGTWNYLYLHFIALAVL